MSVESAAKSNEKIVNQKLSNTALLLSWVDILFSFKGLHYSSNNVLYVIKNSSFIHKKPKGI